MHGCAHWVCVGSHLIEKIVFLFFLFLQCTTCLAGEKMEEKERSFWESLLGVFFVSVILFRFGIFWVPRKWRVVVLILYISKSIFFIKEKAEDKLS